MSWLQEKFMNYSKLRNKTRKHERSLFPGLQFIREELNGWVCDENRVRERAEWAITARGASKFGRFSGITEANVTVRTPARGEERNVADSTHEETTNSS